MSEEKKVNEYEEEEDGWYSEPHFNHVTQTKKESIISEVLGDSYNTYYDTDVVGRDKKKGIFKSILSFLL